jgi:hypothetical protein
MRSEINLALRGLPTDTYTQVRLRLPSHARPAVKEEWLEQTLAGYMTAMALSRPLLTVAEWREVAALVTVADLDVGEVAALMERATALHARRPTLATAAILREYRLRGLISTLAIVDGARMVQVSGDTAIARLREEGRGWV